MAWLIIAQGKVTKDSTPHTTRTVNGQYRQTGPSITEYIAIPVTKAFQYIRGHRIHIVPIVCEYISMYLQRPQWVWAKARKTEAASNTRWPWWRCAISFTWDTPRFGWGPTSSLTSPITPSYRTNCSTSSTDWPKRYKQYFPYIRKIFYILMRSVE